MKVMVTVAVVLWITCFAGSITCQPTTIDGELPRTPILALYSDSALSQGLYAAVYEDGSLVWTERYREYRRPSDVQEYDGTATPTLVSFTVSRVFLTTHELDGLIARIDAHKPVEDWGHRVRVEGQHPPREQVLFFCRDGRSFTMRTNFETTFRRKLQELVDPGATPTPVWPDFAEFEADWLMVKGELFRLIEEKSPSAESLGPVLFEFRYRPRCDGVRIE